MKALTLIALMIFVCQQCIFGVQKQHPKRVSVRETLIVIAHVGECDKPINPLVVTTRLLNHDELFAILQSNLTIGTKQIVLDTADLNVALPTAINLLSNHINDNSFTYGTFEVSVIQPNRKVIRKILRSNKVMEVLKATNNSLQHTNKEIVDYISYLQYRMNRTSQEPQLNLPAIN